MYIQENTPGISLALSGASKGDALKWYQPEQNCYIKANRIDHGREYQDSIAEVIAARVGALLHIDVVPYTLCRIRLDDGKSILGTLSPNFCHENETYLSFETMVESMDEPVQWAASAKENYELVLHLYAKLTGLDARRYLDTMLLFDYLICNEDRHLNNFGILLGDATGAFRFPPLFDNGYALGFMQAEHKPVEQYLYSCKAKPFSTSFSKQLHLVSRLPEGITLPDTIPESVLDDLPLSDSMRAYCMDILCKFVCADQGVFWMKPVDFDIYCKETPVVRVQFDDAGQPQFAVLNNRCLPVLLYGMDGKAAPNAKRLDRFIADRCFPRTRQNADKLLAAIGLSLYQPKLICRKTHGVVAHDHFWLKYADDPPELDGLRRPRS